MSDADRDNETQPEPPPRLTRTFWLLNCIEMFERLAYFALRVVAPAPITRMPSSPTSSG